jgi:hypothetical protein
MTVTPTLPAAQGHDADALLRPWLVRLLGAAARMRRTRLMTRLMARLMTRLATAAGLAMLGQAL